MEKAWFILKQPGYTPEEEHAMGTGKETAPLCVGHFISDLKHLDSVLNRGEIEEFPADMNDSSFAETGGGLKLLFRRTVEHWEQYERLDTYIVQPDMAYVADCLEGKQLAAHIDRKTSWFMFMITGVKVAREGKTASFESNQAEGSAGFELEVPTIAFGNASGEVIHGDTRKFGSSQASDFIWALRLAKVTKGMLMKDWSLEPYLKKAAFDAGEQQVDIRRAVEAEGLANFLVIEDEELDEALVFDDDRESEKGEQLEKFEEKLAAMQKGRDELRISIENLIAEQKQFIEEMTKIKAQLTGAEETPRKQVEEHEKFKKFQKAKDQRHEAQNKEVGNYREAEAEEGSDFFNYARRPPQGHGGLSQLLRPIPQGFVRKLEGGRFCVKTRNRCNDIFEDIIEVSTLEEAEAFFRNVDRYDRLRGPVRKLTTRVWGLCSTLASLVDLRWTRAASLEEGRTNLDLLERAHERAPELATGVPNTGANPVGFGQRPVLPRDNPQDDRHKVFICLAMGRPGEWRLRHAEFMGNASKPSNVTDREMFRTVRKEITRYQGSRGVARLLFPLRPEKAEYYEFTLYNDKNKAVSLDGESAVKGKLPSEHPPPPDNWRHRCPAEEWFFNAPSESDKRDVRQWLSTVRLTDAVCNDLEFESTADSMEYRRCVPWRLRQELRCDSKRFSLGWGFVISFEFDFFTFCCIWGVVALALAVALLCGLVVPKNGPLHGQPGAAVAMFTAPVGALGVIFASAYIYAKQNNYLK